MSDGKRFQIEPVEGFDLSTFVPGEIAKSEFSTQLSTSRQTIRQYVEKSNIMNNTVKKAIELGKTIAKIQEQIEKYNG